MSRSLFLTSALVFSVLLGGILALVSLNSAAAVGDDQSVLQADHDFVQAAGKGDTATVSRVLDADFTWTDADGKTRTRAEALTSVPTPALRNASRAQMRQRTDGQVAAATSDR